MTRVRSLPSSVDLGTRIGSITLPNPIMTASGTAGPGDELAAYFDLASLGAIVVKSLAPYPWPGNPAPRVHETPAGMINSVGLQGPGLERWLDDELPRLERSGARVVVSVWGRTVDDYADAARILSHAPTSVIAVEANLSCPNLDGGHQMFAQDAGAAAQVIAATKIAERPVWAKLSAVVTDLVAIARAVRDAGADALTLVNTLLGMVIDVEHRQPLLGGGGGGLSGPAIHPVAVRSVWDCHAALPDVPLIGVGGVVTAADAVELLLAGASAVQVGTATFADPRAPARVLSELGEWCADRRLTRIDELIGGAHG